ncbi:MAG: hypothetical protein DRP94_04320 [Candidatus Latescibacterota bacterium]|nr:MAG: hypothetical protein DRP94_04320 [Candidatus Latescibacterota bacterium]
MRYVSVLAIVLIWGKVYGVTGMAFLLRDPDARAAAMGNATVGLWGGGLPISGNPARLVPLVGRKLVVGQILWFQGIRQEYLGMAYGKGNKAWGMGLIYCGVGGLEHREGPSEEPQGTFGVYDVALGASLAGELGPLILGGTVKVLYEKIYLYETKGLGVDLGFLWPTPVRGLVLGGAVSNVGYVKDVPLPREVRVGMSYLRGRFLGGVEFRFPRDRKPAAFLGGEVRMGRFYLRAGYTSGRNERNISAGLGLSLGRIEVDYAWVPYYYGLGDTHRLCVRFRT